MEPQITKVSEIEIGIPRETEVATLDKCIEDKQLIENRIAEYQVRLVELDAIIARARELGVKTSAEIAAEQVVEEPPVE